MLQSDIRYGVLSRAGFGFGPGSGLELKKNSGIFRGLMRALCNR